MRSRLMFIILLVLVSLAEQRSPTSRAQGTTYTDPFAYCASVGTIDVPDARYDGPKLPDVIARGLRAATESASEMVAKALMTLTPLQRKTIALAFYEGLTYPQVAERLAIPLSTAKTRIRDGLRRMAVELGGPAGAPVRAAE